MSDQSGQDVSVSANTDTSSSETIRLGEISSPTPDYRESFRTSVPEAFRDEMFVKDFERADNPFEAMFKSYKGLQQQLGARPNGVQLPQQDATPEAWQAYYKQIGVPDNIEAYAVQPITYPEQDKGMGDFLNQAHDGAFMNSLKEVARNAGILPHQWQQLVEGYDKAFISQYKADVDAAVAEQRTLNVEFEQMAQTLYGQKAAQVMDVGQKMITQFVPPNMRGMAEKLPNEALMILSGCLYSIHNQFMREDTGFSTQGGTGPMSETEIRSEVRKLMASDAYNKPRHADYDSTHARVKELYAMIPGWKK